MPIIFSFGIISKTICGLTPFAYQNESYKIVKLSNHLVCLLPKITFTVLFCLSLSILYKTLLNHHNTLASYLVCEHAL